MKKIIERIVESDGTPNENDLWLNGATLKKFQNGEWIPVGDSMGEDEEYTIAQALNDLNERIKELQEQTAQQDYLHVKVGQISAMTEEEKAIIKKHVLSGTIFDVILESEHNGELARIIAVWPQDNSFAVYLCSAESVILLPY